MGIILNIHIGTPASFKAKAEATAVANTRALIQILDGCSYLDKVGQHFWNGEYGKAVESYNKAFTKFEEAKNQLEAVRSYYLDLQTAQDEQPGVQILTNRGFDRSGIDYKQIYSTIFLYIQKEISEIEHLLRMRDSGRTSIQDRDIKSLYDSVSQPGRHLARLVAQNIAWLTEKSKITHAASDFLKHMEIASEVSRSKETS
jgi:hypothetical protein